MLKLNQNQALPVAEKAKVRFCKNERLRKYWRSAPPFEQWLVFGTFQRPSQFLICLIIQDIYFVIKLAHVCRGRGFRLGYFHGKVKNMDGVLIIFHLEEAVFFESVSIGYEAVARTMAYFGVPPFRRRVVEKMAGYTAREIARECLATGNESVLRTFEEKLLVAAAEASDARRELKSGCSGMLRVLLDAGCKVNIYGEHGLERLAVRLKKAGLDGMHLQPLQKDHFETMASVKTLLPAQTSVLVADDEEALAAGEKLGCLLVAPSDGAKEKEGLFAGSIDLENLTARLLRLIDDKSR